MRGDDRDRDLLNLYTPDALGSRLRGYVVLSCHYGNRRRDAAGRDVRGRRRLLLSAPCRSDRGVEFCLRRWLFPRPVHRRPSITIYGFLETSSLCLRGVGPYFYPYCRAGSV